MSSYYGVIFPEFWTGDTGRELRKFGKDAQLLGLYLATNRHANMIGLYRLLVDDVKHETGLGMKAIARAFDATGRTEYAVFDAGSAYVWVRNMARFRLGLKPGEVLEAEDNKVKAVNRIYQALDANPFLGSFFDINQRTLRLKKRREGIGLVVALPSHHQMSGLPSPLEAPCKPVTESGIRNRNREERKAAAKTPRRFQPKEQPEDNIGVITKIAHEAIDIEGVDASEGQIGDAVKSLCAIRGIDYDSDVVRRAVDSAQAQRKAAS